MDVSTSSVKPPRGVRHGERRLRSFMASTRCNSELTPTLRSPLESALLGRPHLRRARPADPPPPRPSPQPQPQPALLAANRSAPTRRRNRLARPTATRRHCRRHAPRTGQGPIHPRIPPHHRRHTIVEQEIALDLRGDRGAVSHPDSVGVGCYRIDLHPSTGATPTSTSAAALTNCRSAHSSPSDST